MPLPGGGRRRIRSFLRGGDANHYAYVGGDPANYVDPTGLAFWTNNTSRSIDVIDTEWNYRRLERGQTADIDGFFNPVQTPFEETSPGDVYRKVNDWTDGSFENGDYDRLRADFEFWDGSSFFDSIDWRAGWKDQEWVEENYAPDRAICESPSL